MPIVTLRDLYIAELQDLLDAERQILEALPTMTEAATSSILREALSEHLERTRVQLQRLELLLRKLDVTADGPPCEAIRGLIVEGRRRIAETERGDVLDAALIGAAQRIEHYEIAAYGCARTYAHTLGDHDATHLLQQTLDEEGAADHRLTSIAEHGINQSAGEDLATDAERQRARLRYVPATELSDFKYREFRVLNDRDEHLGSLDGLVLDSRTRRPVYFVIDSGGWFAGRRFLIPVGLLRADHTSNTLRTELDKEAIHRYPPFNPDTFGETEIDRASAYDLSPEYEPPTWLMTGVWMTEASGFAAVPPRAQTDLPARKPTASSREQAEPRAESELMIARGEPDDRAEAAAQQPAGDDEPRIERYRER